MYEHEHVWSKDASLMCEGEARTLETAVDNSGIVRIGLDGRHSDVIISCATYETRFAG